ncbi:HDOD domain-containing protein [Permianibacter sp. IMCC34836]|uniref:HDOD domain-containing protein n=1 Tax=Permianibacter fluminis TaxID=2738515 RepID=UPI0015566A7B|nr:HDOD domain-containing protein [Permianibacter fluminis]NQD38739.1 HDOD domain-containing protein [Permianibacter fluminis]
MAKTVEEWVAHIAKAELPAFGQTLQQIATLNEFMLSHAAELTRVILRDPTMTAKILRLANSVYFNPSQKRINTISRAVIVLGFQTLRSICVATLLLDELLSRDTGPQLGKEVADAFHAAMQARELALLRKEPNVEEIFIAALLSRIGEISFWACGGDAASKVQQQLTAGVAPDEAEDNVLGFRLRQLTVALAQEWRVSDTLLSSLRSRDASPGAQCVANAFDAIKLVPAVLDNKVKPEQLQTLMSFTGKSEAEIRQHLQAAGERAADVLKACGAGQLVRYVRADAQAQEEPVDAAAEGFNGEPDLKLQLAILRELNTLASSKTDINLVLQLVLEGLHRGAGLPRVLIALLNPPRSELLGKYVVEWPVSNILGRFRFVLNDVPVLQAIVQGQTLWAWRDSDRHAFTLVLKQSGAADCLLGPLSVNGKVIGIVYADRGEQALSAADQEAFELFVSQAALCLRAPTK